MTRSQFYYLAFGILVAAHVALLWSASFVPLTDVPITLTNAYILNHYSDSSLFQALYRIQYVPIPNVGFHLFLTPLLSYTTPQTALKLFLTFLLVIFAIGADRLSASFGHPRSWRAPLMLTLLFSAAFFWGLLNYLLGLAFFFLAFSFWRRWRSNGSNGRRALLMVALATLCYLTHLSSFAFLIMAIVVSIGVERAASRRTATPLYPRKLALDIAIPAAVPVVLFLIFMTRSGSVGKALEVNDLRGKLAYIAAFFHTLRHETLLEFAIPAAILILAALLCTRNKQVDRTAFSIGIAFLILFALSPLELFTSSLADLRFLLPGVCFVVAGISGEVSRKSYSSIIAMASLLIAARLFVLHDEWQSYDARIQREVAALASLKPSTRVFGLFVQDRLDKTDERPLANTMTYGLIYRQLRVLPLLAMSEQSIVALRDTEQVAHLSDDRNPLHTRIHSDKPFNAAALQDILATSDVIWAYLPPAPYRRALDSACDYDTTLDDIAIYRVRR